MEYRREIDGLRAVAVLPVILFHSGLETFSGGFVGVDVFFVISGFLITTIILAELDAGSFSIITFYERRARRILPVLFFITAACVPFTWLLLPPAEVVNFSKSLIAVSFFVSNFFFWRDGAYFETAAELKPLLHTWSLAVEEQFYIFFPPLLAFVWGIGRRFAYWFIAATALLSLAAAQLASEVAPVANFYLLPTRAWELAIGALCAFHSVERRRSALLILTASEEGQAPATGARQALALIGLMLILTPIACFTGETPFPGAYGLIPTTGTALVVLFADRNTHVGKLLGTRALVGIGLISYSAYLWHQPILALTRYATPSPSLALRSALILAVLALSVLSWKYVEGPFRARGTLSRRTVFLTSALISGSFAAFGYLVSRVDFSNEDAMAQTLTRCEAIYSANIDERQFIRARTEHETMSPVAIVLGSSRTMQIGTDVFGGDILNLGVSGASLEDDVAIAYMALRRFNPSIIFVSADPWLLNRRSGQNRWKSLDAEYRAALAELGLADSPPNKVGRHTSRTEISGVAAFYRAINRFRIAAEDDTPSDMHKIRRDGTRVYSLAYANKARSAVDRDAISFATYAMSPFEYSSEAEKLLLAFLRKESRNRRVVLVLAPYHPRLYRFMQAQRPEFLSLERSFRDIAKQSGVEIVGSYDPGKVSCTADEFYDGMHPRPSCMRKVLAHIKPAR